MKVSISRRRNLSARALSSAVSHDIEGLERRQMLSAAVSKAVSPSALSLLTGPVQATTVATNKATTKTSDVFIPSSDITAAGTTQAGKAYYTNYQRLNGGKVVALPGGEDGGTVQPFTSGPFTPTQIRTAYGVSSVFFGSVLGNGNGQTIAIVDAFDDVSMVSSTASNYAQSDINRFSSAFGLNTNFSFTKVNQSGGTSYPAYNSGWAGEIALDVEWAHAMAPNASIVLVEATNNSNANLNAAVQYAETIPGVSAISMSYGGGEFSGETTFDPLYVTPAGHTGITFFSSTGDSGSPGSYQAYSPNIVAVGGTQLTTNTNAYVSETGWSGSGGGTSVYESKPTYQNLVTTPSSTKRTIPDVSMDAAPASGVYVLDTSTGGFGSADQYYQVGGTSLSSPLWAGLMAVTNQGRASVGLSTLYSAPAVGSTTGNTVQTLPRLYQLAASDYHDVTSGSNGSFTATAGYDNVTGRGSPVANLLLSHLAGAVNISGTDFADFNGNGTADAGETRFGSQSVYLDYNNNGVYDSTYEPAATTAADGSYSFTDQVAGRTYAVRLVSASVPAGYTALSGAAFTTGTTVFNTPVSNANFTYFPTTYSGTAFTLRTDAAGTTEQIFTTSTATGTPTYSATKSLLSSLTFSGTSGSDTLNIDLGNGTPLPSGGISYDGGPGSDTVTITGSIGADTVAAAGSAMTLNGAGGFTYSNVEALAVNLDGGNDTFNFASPAATTVTYDPGTGSDTLNVQTGNFTAASDLGNGGASSLAVNVSNNATITLNSTQHLASMSIASGGKAIVGANGSRVLVLGSLGLTGTGTLDLNDNDAIVRGATSFATLQAYISSGRDNGQWDGLGITSSTAKPASPSDPVTPYGLGYLSGADYSSIVATNTVFDGETFNSTDTLIKYTYNGDADLNGKVNANDYARVDAAFQNQSASGFVFDWFTGDFNFDGKIDANDYALIDAAFNLQTSVL